MINYKLIGTQFGEAIKYETSVNEINRTFIALTNEIYRDYQNPAITSTRSLVVYSWVNTIADSSLTEDEKVDVIKQAIELLVQKESTKLRLFSILPREQNIIKSRGHYYVNPERIKELESVKSTRFDFIKLRQLCTELNLAFGNKSFFSVAMIVRSILDHVPPIFSCRSFSEISNNYNGSKSFKESTVQLNNSSRKIADAFLHVQIRKKESLPNSTQVDFSNDLDVLLAEIIRIS